VPDSLPLDGLIWYNTTGTTGHPLRIISHPVTSACYLPLLRVALAAYGIRLTAGRGRVAYVLVGWQRKSYAYPSVVPEMDDAGCAKLNLHPADWNAPDDRAKFLDDCDPEFYTGDPLAFAEMARLPMRTRPRALISTAMMLLPGLRQSLEDRFGCPVIDIYSMNETGPIAYLSPDGDGYVPLQPRLYIEILDSQSRPCPAGVPGEVVLSGGMNPFLPLLRYRTNDFASLTFHGRLPLITGLQGRPPTLFRTRDGRILNNLDVTNALAPLALPQFTLHQSANGALTMQLRDADGAMDHARTVLLGLFGDDQPLTLKMVASLGDKVIQYTSDMTA
jgi:phenylacetate-CoA ligase